MTEKNLSILNELLRSYESGLIALSGGVDSAVLLALGAEFPDFHAVAATVVSPAHPSHETAAATALARRYGVEHHVIAVDQLSDPLIRENRPDRCRHCKRLLYRHLVKLAQDLCLAEVLDGSHADDSPEDRPGFLSLKELGIRTPLRDAGLTKADIRVLARSRNLPMWDTPATACLFTRIPTGEPLDRQRLKRIEQSENDLRGFGFVSVRVRDHGTVARIELPERAVRRLMDNTMRHQIVRALRKRGYQFVTVDLAGYQYGAMNTPPGGGDLVDS